MPLACRPRSATRILKNSRELLREHEPPWRDAHCAGTIDDETATRLKRTNSKELQPAKQIGTLCSSAATACSSIPMAVTAEAAQLVEQLNWTVVDVARAFHMPLFKIGAETGRNAGTLSIEAQQQAYLNDCLQIHITSIEAVPDRRAGVPGGYEVEIDEDDMLRMDKSALYTALGEGVKNT
jgi:hypothetical protein